jgi:hypothetical protein
MAQRSLHAVTKVYYGSYAKLILSRTQYHNIAKVSRGSRGIGAPLPTRPRLWEELVLRTYHSENGPREAGDGEAAQAVFNGGGDGVWRLSSSRDSSGGGGVGGGILLQATNQRGRLRCGG